MKKNIIIGAILASGSIVAQQVGIGVGNSRPTSGVTLDIITKTSTKDNKAIKVVNKDGYTLFEGLDNGDFGIGKTLYSPDAQLTIFGNNNQYNALEPAFQVSYADAPQKWGIYILPKQGELTPAYAKGIALILDNDGIKNQYYTANNYGTFFGPHTNDLGLTGIFLAESGTTTFSARRPDQDPSNIHYFQTNKVGAFLNASLRIQDENKGYAAGADCIHPGTMAFDSANNSFLGCVEIYENDVNTGKMVWKKLNNN